MKPINACVVSAAYLLLIPALAVAAPSAAPGKKPPAAEQAQSQEFPLVFKGKELIISRQAKRAELEPALTKILGAKTELEEADMIQYDVQLTPDQGPVTAAFVWSKKGVLERVTLDAYMEVQNPPAKTLKAWLTKNAGPGKSVRNKKTETSATTWNHCGWRFVFTEGGDGDDSSYSFEITPIKTK